MGKTLVLIDGHALAFRQYFALERTAMKNSQNQPTWAVYGFFKAIFDLLKKIKPDSIAVTFDVSHHTFRTEMYEEYKANRESMPDSLSVQMGFICEGLQAFDIPIYTKEGFEADDLIGTISQRALNRGDQTLILTGDQDAFQLVDKDGLIKVLIPSKGELFEYGWSQVYDKLGVYPNQVVDYKALRGDTSDNIPGIRGIGPKTAQDLLGKYTNLENILADCENIDKKSVKEKICAEKDKAILSKKLATIIRDVDIDFDFDKAQIILPNIDKVSDFLKNMQFYSFIKNINSILKTFNVEAEVKETPTILEVKTEQAPDIGQLGLFSQAVKESVGDTDFESKKIESDSDYDELVSQIKQAECVAFNIYNEQEKILGVSVGVNDKGYFLDSSYLGKLKPILEDKDISKSFYDAKRIINLLRLNGIELRGIKSDILLAAYVKDSNRNYSIDFMAMDFINHIMIDKVQLTEECTAGMWKYAADEGYTILKLTKFFEENLTKTEKKIYKELELPTTEVLAKMEYTGVSIDKEYLHTLSEYMTQRLAELEEFIYQLGGGIFNINSPKQVAEVLYDRLGIKSKKKKSRSTSAEILEELALEYEICDYILQHRKFAKLKSTYTDSLPTLISKRDNRIHTTYNQALTVTGRLSSSNPNLQNIPIRTEEGNKIRNAFCSADKENNLILSADYSQIELRLLAHISGDEHLIEAFNSNDDVHSLTASKIFGVELEEVTKDMRRKAKAVNFGIVYGQSKYGLAKVLEITPAQAQEFIDKYFESYPKIKEYMESKIEFAHLNGYVETMIGRRRYLAAELGSSNYQMREFAQRAAINQPLQGTASDLIKQAMINIDKELSAKGLKTKMIMQVHDELVFEVPKQELDVVKEIVIKGMELEQPFRVPLVVDVNCGESWKE